MEDGVQKGSSDLPLATVLVNTWSALHLSRTMLTGYFTGLRGSFRLRLALIFNHRPKSSSN